MTIKSGFFNSDSNHDRKYNAEDFSHLFEGIIKNGVLYSVGNRFSQIPISINGSPYIRINSGKAWIDGYWISIEGSSYESIALSPSISGGDKWDLIYLEINTNEAYRSGSIKIVSSQNSTKPSIQTTNGIKTLPLCYVHRRNGVSVPLQSDVENLVGTSSCPYVALGAQSDVSSQIETIFERLNSLNRSDFGIYVGTDEAEVANANLSLQNGDIYIKIENS